MAFVPIKNDTTIAAKELCCGGLWRCRRISTRTRHDPTRIGLRSQSFTQSPVGSRGRSSGGGISTRRVGTTPRCLLCCGRCCLMWGPGIAALISFALFRGRHRRTITFWGNSRIRSLCFYLLPIVLLGFTRPRATDRVLISIVRNPQDFVGRTNALLFVAYAVLAFAAALGEELGWRGFLQDAVRPARLAHSPP
jgi:hypothetical protein